MPELSTTTSIGTIITLSERDGMTVVHLDHPDAPADMRNIEAGRIIGGGYQPTPCAAWALEPSALRALADLIEESDRA